MDLTADDLKELVGVCLSGHPLDGSRSALRRAGVVSTQPLAARLSAGEWSEKQPVTVGGILKSRRQKITKKNEIMAFCVLEDLQGECELIVFPSALEKLSPLLSEGAVLLVTGTAQLREAVSEDGEDELKLLVRTASRAAPDGTAAEAEKPARTRAGVYLKITADNEKVLDEALASYNQMRATEGKKLAEDIGGRLTTIETLTGKVEERSPETVREYREKLTARMQEVLQSTTIDASRILPEAANYADKVAEDEETVRLRSHVSQLRDMLLSDEPMGRKMDFLIQEVNRESNTIGSKCNDITIARDVVALKAEVEKIREQVQNIE